MLIIDEPSLGLSPLFVKEVMAAIRRVAETGLPILLVEQSVKQVLNGPSEELQGHPMIRKAYLGL
jgi:branched-chain amino acid transport system ATP-binding protein